MLLAGVWLDIPELNDQVYIIFLYEIVLYMAMYWGGSGGGGVEHKLFNTKKK